MDSLMYMTKSFTVLGVDGNHITVSETTERREVVIAVQQNDEHGRIATIRLNAAQFDALCGTKYSLDVADAEPERPEVPEAG